MSFSIESHMRAVSSVASLSFPIDPNAVVRGIIFIYVYPFQGISLIWLRSHIDVKVAERMQPSLAYYNATTAVVIVRCLVFSTNGSHLTS